MKVGVAALCAGIVGGVGVLLFLTAFGTDYWLLATEDCGIFESEQVILPSGKRLDFQQLPNVHKISGKMRDGFKQYETTF
ncbi:hypothetical protein NDU88_002583 [Pleurodeles waltl]|uniref:Transmembrane protein 182 n=1 Tax=Pleurodeles waltl TaxID=8319 RepID=A0AAV7VFC3_PLEWA|nr:hypothetical protein NDU88_002583 [Pleurodeles waltl]